jgi:hypothetical protein
MACVVPDAQLTAEEKQCCTEMGGACQPDQSGVPMSHPCCKPTIQPRNDFRPSSTFAVRAQFLAVGILRKRLAGTENTKQLAPVLSHTSRNRLVKQVLTPTCWQLFVGIKPELIR